MIPVVAIFQQVPGSLSARLTLCTNQAMRFDFCSNLREGQNFICQSRHGNGGRHAPDDTGSLVLRNDRASNTCNVMTAFDPIFTHSCQHYSQGGTSIMFCSRS